MRPISKICVDRLDTSVITFKDVTLSVKLFRFFFCRSYAVYHLWVTTDSTLTWENNTQIDCVLLPDDVTIMTSSSRKVVCIFRIKFPTKRIIRIFRILRTDGMAPFCNLFIKRPWYFNFVYGLQQNRSRTTERNWNNNHLRGASTHSQQVTIEEHCTDTWGVCRGCSRILEWEGQWTAQFQIGGHIPGIL